MGRSSEKAVIEVDINKESASKKIKELSATLEELKKKKQEALLAGDQKLAGGLDKEIQSIRRDLKQWNKDVVDVERVLQNLNKVSPNALKSALRSLKVEFGKLEQGSREYEETLQKITKLEGQIGQIGGDKGGGSGGFNPMGSLKGVLSVAGLTMLATKALSTIRSTVIEGTKSFAEYDDKLADVMKTTGLAKTETEALSDRLKRINTRTSQLELLDLARVAGKLGMSASEDVEAFVKAADKINVALSEDLGGNAEEALNKVGKLVDIFDLKNKYGIEDSMIRVGSTINELGAASTANEGYIVDFTNRLAGVAPQAGISIGNVMGLGATLDQFGQQCETSGTTVSQVITGMFKKTDQYARIAGMGVKEFSTLLNQDANAAFIAFLRGLKNSEGGMFGMTRNLASLKLEGSRATQILGVLATDVDTLEQQQQLANRAFADGTSILNEFNTKNNSAQAEFEKARKILKNWSVEIGEKLMPAVYSLTGALSKLAATSQQQLQDEVDRYKANRSEIEQKNRSLGSLVGTYNELKSKVSLTEEQQILLNDSIKKIGEICPAAITNTNEYGEAIDINIDRLNRAVEAQEKLNKAMGQKASSESYEQLKRQRTELEVAQRSMQRYADQMDAINSGKYVSSGYNSGALSAYENSKNPRDEAENGYNNARDRIRNLNADMKQNILNLADMGEYTSNIAEASGKSATAIIDLVNGTKELAKVQNDLKDGGGGFSDDSKSNSKKQWTVEHDAEFMAAKIELRRKLNAGEIATEEDHDKQLLVLEIVSLDKRIKLQKEKGTDLQKLQEQLESKRYQQQKSNLARQEQLRDMSLRGGRGDSRGLQYEQEDFRYAQELKTSGLNGDRSKMTIEEHAALERLEAIHIQRMQSIYMDGLSKEYDTKKAAFDRIENETKIAHNNELSDADTFGKKKALIAKLYGSDNAPKVRTDKEASRKIKQFYEQEEQKQTREHCNELLGIYDKMMSEVGNVMDGDVALGILNDEDKARIQKIIDDLKRELASLNKDAAVDSDLDKVNLLGSTGTQWDTLFKNLKAGKLGIDDWKTALGGVGDAFGKISQLMSAAENRELKKFEQTAKKKKKSLEQQLAAGTVSQEQYHSKVEQLDAEVERKREETERKQAIRDKAMAVFQSLIQTGVAVAQALPNIPLAIAIGVLGAIQTATILATPLPGAEDGGWLDVERQQDGKRFRAQYDPTRRGYVSDPRVIVAEAGTEYVVPNEGYENPTVRPVLDLIESARRNGTLRSINLPAVMSAYAVPGRSQGGYAGDSGRASFNPVPDSNSYNNMPLDRETVQELIEGIRKFNRTCSRPLDVNNYAGGRRGISKALKDYNRIRSNAFM